MQTNTPTCLSCAHNKNGKCKLTGRDMYENRMLRVDQGGCGENAVKYQPLYEEIEVEEQVREPYIWA